jgi:xanthine dehydrogenase small subunit
MAMDAKVVLANVHGSREVVLKNFYLGYKTLDLKSDELVIAIKIPRIKANEYLKLYKVSMRKDLDISAATFAGVVEVDNGKIKSLRVALGGVGPTVMRMNQIEQDVIGLDFTSSTFETIAQNLPQFISPLSDLRASKEYRLLVAQNFVRKFYFELTNGAGV